MKCGAAGRCATLEHARKFRTTHDEDECNGGKVFRHIVRAHRLQQFVEIVPCAFRGISMTHPREISKVPGIGRVCGLLGAAEVAGGNAEGLVIVLGEIVQQFRIEWELTPYQGTDSAEHPEAGFVLELMGTHQLAGIHSELSCLHCANLMLGLRIVADWLFPPQGRCSYCEVLTRSNFVRGGLHAQQEACSTRALRLASQQGPSCELGTCHLWCTAKIKDRLNVIGAVERKRKPVSTGRAGS